MAAADHQTLTSHLLLRIREVRRHLGAEAPVPEDGEARFADLLDSMGLVEFLLLLADDCGVPPERIEQAVGREFGSVAELAARLEAAGLAPRCAVAKPSDLAESARSAPPASPLCNWLAATAVHLPKTVQAADELDDLLGRSRGWWQRHTGIRQRGLWAAEDPIAAAADAARQCLEQANTTPRDVGALLVTSEAPPLLTGLAAALHHRLELRPEAIALEIGGACTGLVAAVWLARQVNVVPPVVLLVAVEAATRYLEVRPGSTGEAAALFGDGAAACLLAATPVNEASRRIRDVTFGADGAAAHLIQVHATAQQPIELRLEGQALSIRAVKTLAQTVRALVEKNELQLADVGAIIVHGGNGRLPALVARQLELPAERVWSETAATGNLGAASLPVAWAAGPPPSGPVVWAAIGAGLTWGAVLLDAPGQTSD